jgi:hypothetical protein
VHLCLQQLPETTSHSLFPSNLICEATGDLLSDLVIQIKNLGTIAVLKPNGVSHGFSPDGHPIFLLFQAQTLLIRMSTVWVDSLTS